MPLRMSSHRDGGDVTLAARGVIDLATAKQLEGSIAAAIADDAARSVVVDLTEVTFLDSVGISALLKGRRWADEHGRRYRVTGAAGLVRDVLDLTGVWTHLSSDVT